MQLYIAVAVEYNVLKSELTVPLCAIMSVRESGSSWWNNKIELRKDDDGRQHEQIQQTTKFKFI